MTFAPGNDAGTRPAAVTPTRSGAAPSRSGAAPSRSGAVRAQARDSAAPRRPDSAAPGRPEAASVGRPGAATVRRRELAAFLRSRRERIAPDQVGLPPGGRRRTPGLRREEVAQLAGVGVTWYTWLEQGRDIHASEQVLAAIAGTLRLDPYERAHLYTLAGQPEPVRTRDCLAITDPIRIMLTQLEPIPAVVSNARFDILAYNRTYEEMVGGLADLPFEDRNTLVLTFISPAWRARMLDWEAAAALRVAQFRAAMA